MNDAERDEQMEKVIESLTARAGEDARTYLTMAYLVGWRNGYIERRDE